MNGKIKTKFAALFAVALMITVCVVPMVGGSEDVEAADPGVTIKGYVYNADGTSGIDGAIVYIGSTYDKDMKLQAVTGDDPSTSGVTEKGYFSIAKVPKGDIVVNVVTNDKDRGAYNLAMPTITLKNVTSEQTVKFVAGTVQVEGKLMKKDQVSSTDVPVFLKDIAIMNGSNKVATTDSDGGYSFLAKVGDTFTLTATTGTNGITFKSAQFTVSNGTSGVMGGQILRAEKGILDATVTAPIGVLSSTIADTSVNTNIAWATLGATSFGVDTNGVWHAYAPITVSTPGNGQTPVAINVSINYDSAGTNGLGSMTGSVGVVSSNANDATVVLTAPYVVSGDVYIGDDITTGVKVIPSAVKLKAMKTDTTVEKTAAIIGSKYYVGYKGIETSITDYSVTIQATYTGYVFNPVSVTNLATTTIQTVNCFSDNEVRVAGFIGPAGTEFQIAGNNIVVADVYKSKTAGKYVAANVTIDSTSGTGYEFFVPKGSSVTVTAPANYVPASETISAVNADTTISTFTYLPNITYTGQIFLNGVPVKENISYSVNGKDGSYVSVPDTIDSLGCGWIWEKETGWIYKLSVDRSIEASEIFIKVGQTGAGGTVAPTFQYDVDAEGKFVPVGISNGKFADINVKKQDVTATVADEDLAIPGMEVEFQMLQMTSDTDTAYNKNKVVAELGKATTDAKGVAKISAAWSGSEIYRIFAVPGGESDFGTYEVSEIMVVYDGTYNKMNASVELDDQTVYGFYTADATAIPGLEISYIEYAAGDKLVGSGKATIIDNMYYIVLDGGNNVKLSVDDKYKATFVSTGYNAGSNDLIISVKPDNPNVTVTLLPNEYSNFVEISKTGASLKGQVIVLSAEKTCYKIQNDVFGYQYTDAAVEYTFAGWYVNGKLLTEDCDASLTLTEDVVIVAQYEEAVKVIGSEDVPEAGLDTNVLILGIVVVVIALIAVVYSVISKRD